MRKCRRYLGLLMLLMAPSAQAMNTEIRALFQPDPAQPNKNVFINKTPSSGYCAEWPAQCQENSIFSIRLPVRFESTRSIFPGDGFPIRAPANWRQLTVTNVDTQESEKVEVRIIGVGSKYLLSQSAASLTGAATNLEGHEKLWGNSAWVNAPAPCQYSGVGVYHTHWFQFFWKTPVEAACTKTASYRVPSMSFENLDFAYELRTPNPLGMSSGLYTGSLHYSIGPGGDFDLGPLMRPDDGSLSLDFVLDVQHTLKVDLPPGGNRVAMEPQGGWQQWLEGGRKPTAIYRDQLFYLSASSRFKVMMICASSLGGPDCRMHSPKGNTTMFQVFLTLPNGITGPGDLARGVNRVPLQHNTWIGPFQPSLYLDRKPGSLRFAMTPFAIEFLLRPGFTDTLTGNVTIIWDSEA